MKVKIICICLFCCFILTSCKSKNDVEIEYLDYEGYTLVTVLTEGFWDGRSYYGYIFTEDYEKYKNGENIRTLTIKNPFIEDNETTVTTDNISYITTGMNEYQENYLKEKISNNSLDK